MTVAKIVSAGLLAMCTAFPVTAFDRDSDSDVISAGKPIQTDPYQFFTSEQLAEIFAEIGEQNILVKSDMGVPIVYNGYRFSYVPYAWTTTEVIQTVGVPPSPSDKVVLRGETFEVVKSGRDVFLRSPESGRAIAIRPASSAAADVNPKRFGLD